MATVKENGLTYKLLKRQITKDINNEEMDWVEQYPYRLSQINIFDGKRITNIEAEELRLMIEPYKPITKEETTESGETPEEETSTEE